METGREVLSFLVIAFQRDTSQVLRKKFLDCKASMRLGEDLHLKEAEKNLHLNVFFSSKNCKKREVRDLESERNLSEV